MTQNILSLALLALFLPMGFTLAAADSKDLIRRIEVLESEIERLKTERSDVDRKQAILTEEVRKVRDSIVLPEKKALKGAFGMGPAASKVYGLDQGLSIGGYGQAWYQALVEDKQTTDSNSFDFKRLILYAGYKFNDWIVLNSEIEFEHASTEDGGNGAGSVSVEFAQLDFFLRDAFNIRLGMLLMPVGFTNETHEPNFYHGNERPEVEIRIIPTTWRENGIGAFGQIGERLTYRAYAVTSMNGTRFDESGIRGGRQNGTRSLAEDISVVARLDYQASPNSMIGGSVYTGNQGQEKRVTLDAAGNSVEPDVDMTLFEVHAQYRKKGLELRALGAMSTIENAAELSAAHIATQVAAGAPLTGTEVVGERQKGFYLEAA